MGPIIMKKPRMREHRGDIMSAEKRSALMARIKGRDTGPELAIASELRRLRLFWDAHPFDLPGRPDFAFRQEQLAVFVDGDFWHGWRFPAWRHKLSEAWEAKLEANVKRDQRNRRKLRRQGWTVLRIWEHEIEQDTARCIAKILGKLQPSIRDSSQSARGLSTEASVVRSRTARR